MLTYSGSRIISVYQTQQGPYVALTATEWPFEFHVVNLDTEFGFGPYGSLEAAFAGRETMVTGLGGYAKDEETP